MDGSSKALGEDSSSEDARAPKQISHSNNNSSKLLEIKKHLHNAFVHHILILGHPVQSQKLESVT